MNYFPDLISKVLHIAIRSQVDDGVLRKSDKSFLGLFKVLTIERFRISESERTKKKFLKETQRSKAV